MSETEALFSVLRQSAPPQPVAAIERLIAEGPDGALSRVNTLDFATKNGLDVEETVAAFLHAARLGIFDLSWNVLCPGCGGVLEAGATLKNIDHDMYDCALCSAGYEATLDEMVEIVHRQSSGPQEDPGARSRALPSHAEYFRQIFWSLGIDLPEGSLEDVLEEIELEAVDLPAGEKALISLQMPAEFIIVFDPVTHGTQFIDVKGEPTKERQSLTMVFNNVIGANRHGGDAPRAAAAFTRKSHQPSRASGRMDRWPRAA